MNTAQQLEWEARLRRPAAYAAFGAGLLALVGTVVYQSVFDDREGVRPVPDFLLSVNESPGTVIAATVLQALAALLLILVFFYLFRATIHRNAAMPSWFVYFVFIGPVLLAVSQPLGAIDRIDVAQTFADGDYSFETADAEEGPDLARCPATRGALGEACAEELQRDNTNNVSGVIGLVGSVLVAFLFVMLPLRARRAGLLSPFMGILGVVIGALLVLFPPPLPLLIEAFWLGALGALFLGNWPGGRGPAWASGKAEPWPTAAQRRGVANAPDERGAEEADVEPDGTIEGEPAAQRPSSRKRKRKGR